MNETAESPPEAAWETEFAAAASASADPRRDAILAEVCAVVRDKCTRWPAFTGHFTAAAKEAMRYPDPLRLLPAVRGATRPQRFGAVVGERWDWTPSGCANGAREGVRALAASQGQGHGVPPDCGDEASINEAALPEKTAAERALAEWAANNARRDSIVRAALDAGVAKSEVHKLTGIARTTIDRIAAS